MGYIRHNAIVVTCGFEGITKIVHTKAVEIFDNKVTNIVEGAINQYYSFLIVPDGSKEGWRESDEWDVKRNDFIEYLENYKLDEMSTYAEYVDYAEISFGGDDRKTYIVRTNES